jgi:hypothetical protein
MGIEGLKLIICLLSINVMIIAFLMLKTILLQKRMLNIIEDILNRQKNIFKDFLDIDNEGS